MAAKKWKAISLQINSVTWKTRWQLQEGAERLGDEAKKKSQQGEFRVESNGTQNEKTLNLLLHFA